MRCKEKLEAYLRENQVAYQVQHHPLAYTAQEVASSEHIPGKEVAKVVIVMAGGERKMLVLPASERLDVREAAAELGVGEVRLAYEAEFASAFPDCEVGAMPPFGNLYNMPVYVDRSLAEDETIVFQAGTHTDTMSMRYADYERLVHPVVASLSLEKTPHYTG